MRVVDLTMRITPSIKVFPGSPQPSFIPWSRFESHGYDSEAMFMSTHTGTHVDAPSHFVPGLASIDMVPAGRLVSGAVLPLMSSMGVPFRPRWPTASRSAGRGAG